mgnify:CR=1 FL=1
MENIIVFAIVLVFVVIVFIVAKKGNDRDAKYVSELSEGDKKNIMDNEVKFVEGKKNTWTQKGYICDIKEKRNDKVALVILWYNSVIKNGGPHDNSIQGADVTIKKSELESHGLKVGSYIRFEMAPEKISSVRIIFD